MKKIKMLFIMGPSGAGKSYVAMNLMKKYPNEFHILQQCTTRPKRIDENNNYIWLTETGYKLLEKSLICRVKKTFFPSMYGTIPNFSKDKINIVVVNKEGLIDFKLSKIKDSINCDYKVIGIFADNKILSEELEKRNRTEEFIKQELFDTNEMVNIKFQNDRNEKILTDIYGYLQEVNYIN